jgi:hypothetical protein
MVETSYTSGATESGGPQQIGAASIDGKQPGDYWDLGKLKAAFLDYLGSKGEEIEEQKDARRYYHASQWTEEQIKTLKKRNQPPTVFNRVGRKIDGVVGLVERIKQDPKAYPRTPKHEEGAELATAVVRYVMDEQRFDEKRPEVARKGAVDGIAGIEINIVQGDQGDPEVELEIVEPDSFFYDPRSYRADFTDAAFLGVAKWLDIDTAQGMFPDHADDLTALEDSTEFTSSPDRERKWFSITGTKRQVRVVDLWYRHKGEWCFAIFTGSTILMEGKSYLRDQKKKGQCKYVMYSSNVDQDGDRYGFVRNLKWPQDAINARQSKMQHILASRRLILSQGAVQDVEVARREWARPDGVVLVNGAVNEGAKADDQSFDFAGWTKMMEMALAEVENFGPNPALIGQGIENKSGRAIQLLQQAGMADLGPYLSGFKGWVLRVYRAVFNAVQQHWQAERWIRVTDDDGLAQFIQINGMGVDPQTGQPAIVNALGSLDVDIILDEGPDAVNMQADAYDTLTILAGQGAQVPPAVLIELSPLPSSQKKRIQDMLEQQGQSPQAQIQQRGMMAEVADKEAAAGLKQAQTQKTMIEAQTLPAQIQADMMGNAMGGEMPQPVESQKVAAEAEDKLASADLKRAQTAKVMTETALMPEQMRMDAQDRAIDRQMNFQNAAEDRKIKAKQASQKAKTPA